VSSDGRRGSSATPFCLVFITDRRPHSPIHRREPSLSGCRCSYLEQFTTARHFCTFVDCLPIAPKDASIYYFPSQSVTMYSARALTLHFGHFSRSCSLLTIRCRLKDPELVLCSSDSSVYSNFRSTPFVCTYKISSFNNHTYLFFDDVICLDTTTFQ